MTVSSSATLGNQEDEGLDEEARALARAQPELVRASTFFTTGHEAGYFVAAFEKVCERVGSAADADDVVPKPIEWFLDNYHLIRRVARQVEVDLPRGFARRLPQLVSGPDSGRSRVAVVARALVAKRPIPELSVLQRFLDSYQSISPLTIAELWALPTMLRSAILERLLELFRTNESIAGDLSSDADIELTLGVELAVRALRVLDTLDWKVLFETTNRVEAILRADPAGVYAGMDFGTRDSYRKVVEALAWSTEIDESEVARIATAAARAAGPERNDHVGYYLVGPGRSALEITLEYHPVGLARIRDAILARPTVGYLAPLALLTWGPLLVAAIELAEHGVSLWIIAAFFFAAIAPISAIAVAALRALFARLLPPRTLPKMDFSQGIPADARALVVMPTLLGRVDDVVAMLRNIELHYLSNPDPALRFALLTDDVDAETLDETPERKSLLALATDGIGRLNAKHAVEGRAPFHLLHRAQRWNATEGRFMGWERKRGKLEELNKLLRGDTSTSYSLHVGDPRGLENVRFVITLDSDTELPMGTAHQLVGALAHPLNRAVFDGRSTRVVEGYTIIQPRIETSPSSLRQTPFSRMFAGEIGKDIYTHASSELYQDLFGAGIYVGKGIYDVDSFMRSLDGRAPENALVSHDLFEGIQGRTALATDIVLFESYPSTYSTYATRMHRWVRGDWQLFPWLFPSVPSALGPRSKNDRPHIDRWKILDNLRRSLSGPSLLALFLIAWGSQGAGAWTLVVMALLVAPFLPEIAQRRTRWQALGRAALAVVFLAHEACVVVDAIVRVWIRKTITGKHLLEWTSAAHDSFALGRRSSRLTLWRTMASSPAIAIGVAVVLALREPASLSGAAPVLLLWVLAPEIARYLSRPAARGVAVLRDDDRRDLRRLARRTWRFFDAFVGPNDQWLPVDNYQDAPREQTAHRTSPTNIGLMLVATLTAYDFGYVGPTELAIRLRRTFESIARLPHYQGHLLNWYDTKSLQPLLPRYVSTVDSGNFAGSLLALKQGCKDVSRARVVRPEAWDGLGDSIALLDEVLAPAPVELARHLHLVIARMETLVTKGRDRPNEAYATLRLLCGDVGEELDRGLLSFLETGAFRHEADSLKALRTAATRLHQQLGQMLRELAGLLPWLALTEEALAHAVVLPIDCPLDEVSAVCALLRVELRTKDDARRARGEWSEDLARSAALLDDAFLRAEKNASALVLELAALAQRADDEALGMDFRLLYDEERKLFHIGYNATIDVPDAHYYDLLASEARLASFVAIIKGDVPESHWYALGRPMTRAGRATALLSWGGTMFEYLMPGLFMRSQEGTLLEQTCAAVVDAHIAYGEEREEPWGVSESAYARTDAGQTYQYRSFGVPGLGLKRGLADDRVVAPYASLLAVAIRPDAVVENVHALEALGMRGTYGLYESIDFTEGRALEPDSKTSNATIVRSYMAHHQGMLLVALGNVLNARSMVDRFHSDPRVEMGEALLNERAPHDVPSELPPTEGRKIVQVPTVQTSRAPAPWESLEGVGHQAFALSNGRMTSVSTGSGSGGLRWEGLALTRYSPDPTCDEGGYRLYVRDEDSRKVWLATSTEGRTSYAVHATSHHLRTDGISTHVDVAVAVDDDVEVRRVTLHNESGRARTLTVTSAARPVLVEDIKAIGHPVFASMFVESERVASLDALVFSRRAQSPDEKPAVLVHRLVVEGEAARAEGYETDRGKFFGRGSTARGPASLRAPGVVRDGHVGAVLDPLMSLTARIELPANGSATIAFVTTVARSRTDALVLARKYGSLHAVGWAFRDAEREAPRRLQRTKVAPELLPSIQRLFSTLLFGNAALRASATARRAFPASQQGLWVHGISGDRPIVMVRVQDVQSVLLREVLAAQAYLRSCTIPFDVVLIEERASGYADDELTSLRNVLVTAGVGDWLDHPGGTFVLVADQMSPGDVRRLESCAWILLDSGASSLASALRLVEESPPKLPIFEATMAPTTDEEGLPPRSLAFDNGIGGFAEDGREYVVDVAPGAPTPAPWSNVLANAQVGCLVSESSLGATWSLNSGENRLTPWRNDPVFDAPSEALYLRDEETAAVWTTTPLPAGGTAEVRVRHGAGYTVYERTSHGLVQEMTVFVPPNASLKVVRLRLKNMLPRYRRLTATYYAEWVLGSRRETQRMYVMTEFDGDRACLLATCDWNKELAGRVAFLASSERAHGWCADRAEFLGRRGDYSRPEALERWGLSGRVDLGVDPCAALQAHLDLGPGQEIETHFLLGQSASHDEALALVARFRDRLEVDASWAALGSFWDDLLGNVRVKTPEPAMDLMLNRWLLYQTVSARLFGRTGFYQSSGAFGYRDQLQDVLALLHVAPSLARAHILEASKHQFEAGDVLHWWHPPSGRGVRTRCSDDLAWLPYVTAEYVAATGDHAILEELTPFLTGDPLRIGEHDRYAEYPATPTAFSLYEHCRRALTHAVTEGTHGLPLMGDGDWNDGMSRVGSEGLGESVWLGWFLAATMDRFAALAECKGEHAERSAWKARSAKMRACIEDVAWDGRWYVRAFHDDGSEVGASGSRECQIDSIAQSWSALSGENLVEETRARRAVQSADQQLVREEDRLVLLFWPPFDGTLHDPGYLQAYPPGVRENGGQYTHAATWLGLAHVALGDGERAERIFRLLNPVLHATTSEDVQRYRVEPYVLAGDVYSCPPWVGRGGWTWYTGAAAWMWRLGVEGILGLRSEGGALRIDPCIPPGWPGFEAWVRFGEQEIHVVVENPLGVSKGIERLFLDDVPVEDPLVPVTPGAKGTRELRVVMGAEREVGAKSALATPRTSTI